MNRDITRTTYRWERWRAVSAGILETAGTTFLLLIAVRALDAGVTAKALVAGGGSLGFILSPWAVILVEKRRWRVSRAAAGFLLVGSAAFLVAALAPLLPVFVMCTVLGSCMVPAIVPLLTHLYHENYPDSERGKLFSRALIIRVLVAVVFSELGGRFLSGHMDRFPWILLMFSMALAWGAWCLARCPSHPLRHTGETHPLRAMRFLKTDRIFRWTMISWMLMGIANMTMFSMRVEYLANPRYGMHFDASRIALLTGVIPSLASLVMTPVWGRLFDRMDFFVLRILLNLGFVISILSFFTGTSLTGLILGSILFGMAGAGGNLTWGLWATKMAPSDRVADYMAVHTCSAGIRGLLAPLLAFHLMLHFSVTVLGWVCSGFIVVASLMIVPEISSRKRPRQAATTIPREGIPD